MPYDPEKHHRHSIRLRDYDYRQEGAYFVTVCTADRGELFGNINDTMEMCLNEYGKIVGESWAGLAERYPYVVLDAWVVMPNHLHGILLITDKGGSPTEGGSRTAPTERKPLGRLIGAFKTMSAKVINQQRDTPGAPVWQRNYYEHIIRNEAGLNAIRQYIQSNPANWRQDNLYVRDNL